MIEKDKVRLAVGKLRDRSNKLKMLLAGSDVKIPVEHEVFVEKLVVDKLIEAFERIVD